MTATRTIAARWGRALVALGACAGLAACSASGKGLVAGLKGKQQTEVAAATPSSVADADGAVSGVRVGFCPKVQLITNEETFRTYEGRDRSVENIKYQASLYDVTRSCKVDGDRLIMDISAAGRLISGPKGGAGGSVNMPIRIAIKDSEGVPYSEIETHSASIGGDRTSDQFIYRRSSVSIPVTNDRRTIVLVGFDEGPPRS